MTIITKLHNFSTSSLCHSNNLRMILPKRRYAVNAKSQPKITFCTRPELLTQQIILTNGATYTIRTTSPKPLIKLIKDTRNHPLWNPTSGDSALDVTGQLSKFTKKFGEEVYDLDFMSSGEALPEITSKDIGIKKDKKKKK
ncbi:8102_t:CDS:1 [Diversispora eburnea]|uniref:Large ribosomal subunit protein bL31c n=1 Tax=Diversispora eburnea TaxID=1213867 RepID=A0A9N8WF85_9GLOM|nr:8102_t:CDS:1 [Diversispora eburnea]